MAAVSWLCSTLMSLNGFSGARTRMARATNYATWMLSDPRIARKPEIKEYV